jgi:hypothetical protein
MISPPQVGGAAPTAPPTFGDMLGNSLMKFASNQLTGGSLGYTPQSGVTFDASRLANFLQQRSNLRRQQNQRTIG